MPQLGSMSLSSLTSCDTSDKTIVIPIASLEPLGEELPLDVFQVITSKIASELSKSDDLIVAPLVSVPYSTPFKGFKGVISLRRTVFMNQLADIVLSASSWGIKKVLFLDGTCYAKSAIDSAMKKYKRKLTQDFTYGIVNWQSDSSIAKVIKQSATGLQSNWRNEIAATLLYSEITDSPFVKTVEKNTNISIELFEQWRRRGKDPEKLKKYYPNGFLSSWENISIDEPLFPILMNTITKNIEKGFIYHVI